MMKWTLRVAVCAAGLMLGACGGEEPNRAKPGAVEASPGTTTEPTTEPATELPQGMSIEVRVLGVDVGDHEAVRLPVRALRVMASGTALTVEQVAAEVDISRENHAPLVGRFQLPAGVESVDVAVELGDTGAVTRAGITEALDLRTPPIAFTSRADWLAGNGHAVVRLSVARSLVRTGDGLLLLPNLSVHH